MEDQLFATAHSEIHAILKLEVTIARKMLPHPKGSKAREHTQFAKQGLFIPIPLKPLCQDEI